MIAASWRDWGICKFKFLKYHIDKVYSFIFIVLHLLSILFTAGGVGNITSSSAIKQHAVFKCCGEGDGLRKTPNFDQNFQLNFGLSLHVQPTKSINHGTTTGANP